jgi:cytochrome c oxidase subunit 2
MWDFPLFPERASTLAGWVDGVFFYVLAITVFFTALICFLVLFFAVKYRRGSRADRSNPPSHNATIEALWIIIPMALALTIFFASTYVYYHLYRYPADAAEVYVLGKQWMWELQHPEGRREINTLHVPVGRAVRLTMTSQDVIHSFYIPAFRVKQDVVPGRYTSLWFEATRPGTYHLFCAEYCGTLHSGMVGEVVVMTQPDFEEWLQSGSVKESMAVEGERLFRQYGCSGCHGRNATVRAPLLDGVYGHAVPLQSGEVVTADERYVRDSILLPRSQVVAGYDPVMPTFETKISEGDLLKIITYIKSIGSTAPAATGAGAGAESRGGSVR